MTSIALDVGRLRRPLVDYLATKLELLPSDAEFAVDHLLRAEQAGKTSHGLIRVSYTTKSGKFGHYGHAPAPSPTRITAGRLSADGTGHFGYPVLQKLIEAGCEEAKQHGVCTATGTRVYPSGALGDWARMSCSQGVGIILVASSPRRVAPLGHSQPIVGTNAICIGIPTEPLPFVADCATSEISHGALLVARATGAELPPRSAVGPDGHPTTSPDRVDPTQGRGALLPFGGSYKAFAISMGIELLASLGGGVPGEIQAGRHGVFCLFLGPDLLAAQLATLSGWLQSKDAEGTRIPGWTSGRRARAQQDRGVVELSQKTLDSLSPLGVIPVTPSGGGGKP